MTLGEMFKQCDQERLAKTYESRDEAKKWESEEGDMYAWNFHQGVASGTVEASFIYDRIRKIAPAVDAMAEMLKEMRGNGRELDARIDVVLKAAGYFKD